MAIDGFTTNGPALVYHGTGSADAMELVGYTRNGVDVRIIKNVREVITDIFGPLTPHTFQDMGEVAEITVPFVAFDRAVVAKVQSRGDRAAVGQLNTPGSLMTSHAFRVGIASSLDSPWDFKKCILRPGMDFRLATTNEPFTLRYWAGPFAAHTVTAGKDTQIWSRSIS